MTEETFLDLVTKYVATRFDRDHQIPYLVIKPNGATRISAANAPSPCRDGRAEKLVAELRVQEPMLAFAGEAKVIGPDQPEEVVLINFYVGVKHVSLFVSIVRQPGEPPVLGAWQCGKIEDGMLNPPAEWN